MNSIYQFAKANSNLNKSKNRMFCFVLAFCIFIVFQYFNFVYIPQIKISTHSMIVFGIDLSSAILSGISLCIVIIILIVMGALCQSFLKQKTMEVAVLSLGGVDLSKISHYLSWQLWFIMVKAIPIGFAIFLVFNPLFNLVVKSTLQLNFNLLFISMEGIVLSLVSLGMLLITFIISSLGYAYRNTLIHLLESLDQSNRALPISQLRMPAFVYWILFIAPIFALGSLAGNSRGTIFILLISLMGLCKILKNSLGKVLFKIRMLFLQGHKETCIAIGRTTMMLRLLSNNIAMQFIAVLSILTFLGNNYNEVSVRLLLYVTLIIMLLMVLFTTIYRNMEDDRHLIKQYQTIYHLGFSIQQLNRITIKELVYTFIINTAFIFIFGLGIIFANTGIMPVLDGICILLSTAVTFLIALLVIYGYRIRIIKQLQNGGVKNG